jgi:hypothetical protein
LTLDNALNITPRILIKDDAGPEVAGPRTGGTTGRARMPVQDGQDRRHAPEAADHGPRGIGRHHRRAAERNFLGFSQVIPLGVFVPLPAQESEP